MRGTWLALLVAGVVALGACGGAASTAKSDGKDQPGLAEMLGATEKANTARFDLHMQMAGGFTSGIDERANGVMDFAKNRGSASMSAQKPAGNETDSAPVEVRWLDGKEYERYDPNANNSDEPVTAAKPWVLTENDGACAGNDSNGFLGAMLGMPGLQTGPGNVLSELADRGVALTRVGTETVRGTDTTHWRAEIPKAATTTTLDGADDCGDTLGGAPPKVEIWTDNENRVRRITMSATANFGSSALSMNATTELYDYGVNVDVSAPPADQISEGDSAVVGGPNSGLSTSSGSASSPNLGTMPVLASGTLGKNKWTLKAGPEGGAGRCFYVEGTPPTSSRFSGSMCIPTGAGTMPRAMILTDAQADGQRLVIGLADPRIAEVTVTFANGSTGTVKTKLGAFSWTGASTSGIRSITAGPTSCTVDKANSERATNECLGVNAS